MLPTISILLIVIIYFYIKKQKRDRSIRASSVPPTITTSFSETVQAMAGPDMPFFLLECARAVGFIFRLPLFLPGVPMVVAIGEAQIARKILQDSKTKKPMNVYSSFDMVTRGPSMLTTEGKFWSHSRKSICPAFAPNCVQNMNKIAMEKVKEWAKTIDDGTPFDVGAEMSSLTLSIICKAGFDFDMSREERQIYLKQLDLAVEEATKVAVNPCRVIFGWALPERRRALKAACEIEKWALKMLYSYRKKKAFEKHENNKGRNLLIDLIENNEEYQNDYEKSAAITGLIIGGYDTTGFTLAWLLIELARNPRVCSILKKDLLMLDPKEWVRSDKLQKIVKEGMRLHPPVLPGSVRITGKEFVHQDRKEKVSIPKGSIVFIPFTLLFHNPKVFKDPEAFLPSRWDNPTKNATESFIPFALGTRNCPGQALAKVELHSVLAYLCSNFDFSIEQEGRNMGLKPKGFFLAASKHKQLGLNSVPVEMSQPDGLSHHPVASAVA